MGKRGPRKQPTAIRLLNGGRPSQKSKTQEPIPASGNLTPPTYIVGKAKEKWDEVLPKLVSMRVMTPADLETLGRYCAVWEQWVRYLDQMRKGLDVLVIRDKDGKVKYMQSAPAATMFVKLGQSLLRMEQEFGLTPSARASMEVPHSSQDSAKAAKFRAFIGA
jgi:P27 family predicted phage terminase small subunit